MRIEGLRTRETGDRIRTQARVSWENASREPFELFFDVPRRDAPHETDSNVFVAASAISAIRSGERRISVEGSVCPLLRDGIVAAAGLFRSWYGCPHPAPAVAPDAGFVAPRALAPRRAAVFASGGVDSSFAVRWNRQNLPPAHPRAFRQAIRIRDLAFPFDPSPERREHVETRSAHAVSVVAASADLEVTEVGTNAMAIEPDFDVFVHWTHGPALVAAGLAAGRRLSDLTVSASHDVWTKIRSWGSHPLLDPLFGTAAVDVHHEGIEATRMEKVAEIARWPEGLSALYVCGAGPFPGGAINCGSCEKCVRTRVALLLAGVERPPSFPDGIPKAADIDALPPIPSSRRLSYYWWELLDALRAAGRFELTEAIGRMIERQRRADAWSSDRGWKGALRRLDRKFLGGLALKARRRWAPR